MTKRLNEELVLRKTKQSNLCDIRKLNCWGNELEDVSILHQMPNVQILSLSINKINTLADFQHCTALQELYVRQNEIRDLNEICYLQGLKNLRSLWLAENPCSSNEDYRHTVIRNLSQLKHLDNIPITDREHKEAISRGKLLTHPDNLPRKPYFSGDESPEKEADEFSRDIETLSVKNKHNVSEGISCNTTYNPSDKLNYPEENFYQSSTIHSQQDYYAINNNNLEGPDDTQSEIKFTSTTTPDLANAKDDLFSSGDHYIEDPYTYRSSVSYQQTNVMPDQATFCSNSNLNNTCYTNDSEDSLEAFSLKKCRSSGGLEKNNVANSFIPLPKLEDFNSGICNRSLPALISQPLKNAYSECFKNESLRQKHNFLRCKKATTKTANVLSAVLCLIKELDMSSLEVVQMVVSSRIEELEEIM